MSKVKMGLAKSKEDAFPIPFFLKTIMNSIEKVTRKRAL